MHQNQSDTEKNPYLQDNLSNEKEEAHATNY